MVSWELQNLFILLFQCVCYILIYAGEDDWGEWTEDVALNKPFLAMSGVYFVPRENASWQQAEAFCVRRQSHLVDINNVHDVRELTVIQQILEMQMIWTGAYVAVNNTTHRPEDFAPEMLRCPDPPRNPFPAGRERTLDSRPVMPSDRTTSRWSRGSHSHRKRPKRAVVAGRMPSGDPRHRPPGPERCGGLKMAPMGASMAHIEYFECSCYRTLKVFCLATKVTYGDDYSGRGNRSSQGTINVCPPGFRECSRTKCFKVENLNNWYLARQVCEGYGASLVQVYSESDLQEALDDPEMARCLAYSPDLTWADYSDLVWRWSNGKDVRYTFWAPRFPRPPIEGCVSTQMEGWMDWPCEKHLQFVCKRDTNDTGSWVGYPGRKSKDAMPSTALYAGVGVLGGVVVVVATALVVVIIIIRRTKSRAEAENVYEKTPAQNNVYEDLARRESVYENDDPEEHKYDKLEISEGQPIDNMDQGDPTEVKHVEEVESGLYDDKDPKSRDVTTAKPIVTRNSRIRRFFKARPRTGDLPKPPEVGPDSGATTGSGTTSDDGYVKLIPSPYHVLPAMAETESPQGVIVPKASVSAELSNASEDSGIADAEVTSAETAGTRCERTDERDDRQVAAPLDT